MAAVKLASRVGKGTDLYEDLRSNLSLVLRGTVVVIDPSVGSTSSQPGYSIWYSGDLVESGVLDIALGRSVPERLQDLARQLRKLYKKHEPDVLIYEDVPPQRYGGGNAEAHASLLKAVGATLSIKGPRGFVRMKPMVWKRLVRSTYVKSDESDAIEMGHIALTVASEIAQADPPRWYSSMA